MNEIEKVSNPEASNQMERFVRIPVKGLDGQTFFLSAREKAVCDVLLATAGNLSAAAREVSVRYKRPVSRETIKMWLSKRIRVRDYVQKRLSEMVEYSSLTKESYFRTIYEMASTDKKVNRSTVQFWKMVGDIKGFNGDSHSGDVAISIDIRQSNGER